ncbi:MAG: methionyl-tRNA formyltransferase [Oscillospiraceae bacterium]|nr:methionyl-tRNA formyltransferase [Oscillospiraceae bacterium]
MRVVFMGTPDFAAASLQKLLDERYNIVGVFSQPDRPRGRGMAVSVSPVKALAQQHGIPVFQPEKLRTPEALETLRALVPDVVVVVAYGRILPEEFLCLPPLGCINVHASLLPKYRGSAPIQWAVLNGEEKTGVSTMYLAPEMDTGDVIFTAEVTIGAFETSGALFDRLKLLGAELLHKTLCAIATGTAPRTPQNDAEATYTVPLDKSMCPIDWSRTPRQIVKQIYGLQPWPVATAELGGVTLRVFAAEYGVRRSDLPPGSVVSAGRDGIELVCGGGETLLITEVQAPGKKRMRAGDYLLGHPLSVN